MTQKLIAVCKFSRDAQQEGLKTGRTYEYLAELPDDANLEELKYAVTCQRVNDGDINVNHGLSTLPRFNVVYITEFKPVSDQLYAGELERLVLCFGMTEFIEHAIRKQKIRTLKANLERRLEEMSIFDKIKSLGVKDEVTTSMAEELKKLLG